jgi:hypothetical protein
VQVHLVGSNTVDPTLSLTDQAKSLTGALLDRSRQRRPLHDRFEFSNRSAMAVIMPVANLWFGYVKVHLDR